MTLTGAIFIAAIFESLGAFIFGGDVVKTIKDGSINPDLIKNPEIFIWAMTAALLSAALVEFANFYWSTCFDNTFIVGGVMGSE